MTNKKKRSWTRRAFLITGTVAGGGLVAGVGGLRYVDKKIQEYSGAGLGDGHSLNAWIRIAPDNTITMAVPRAEMGQGVYTSIPMLLAEELEVDMSTIKVVHPQPEAPYANSFFLADKPKNLYEGLTIMERMAHFMKIVGTGGSTTIRDAYDPLRVIGASAREMLITAAANRWNIDPSNCYAENGHIINKASKEKLTYGELANDAAAIKLPELPALKKQKDFKILGTPAQRLDIPEKVTGEGVFGIDARPENVLFAVMRHATYAGGKIAAIKNKTDVEGMKGVKKVVLLPDGIGAAVVADNTWRARNAALALDFEETGNTTISSKEIEAMMEDAIANNIIATPLDEGNVDEVFEGADQIIEAKYNVPYLAHACMEPMNCTVVVNEESAEVWVGHQAPSVIQGKVSEITEIPQNNVTINITYLGGGFGRRGEVDMVVNATNVAKEMKGTPIQLVYTREEDLRYEMYRPAVASHFKAVLGPKKEIKAWENKMALQSVSFSSMTRIFPSMAEEPKNDPTTIEGAANLPYAMDNARVAFGDLDLPILVGNWRSVGSSQNAFFTESFLDECAHSVGQDPLQFRREKLKEHPRFVAVLDKLAEMSNWEAPLPEGTFRGIALHESFGSIVGEIAEISLVGEKEISIDKVYCAIDCGRIVNPNTVEAQMQSGIIYGLTAALYGEISFRDGQVEQYNFPQYEMVRMAVAPVMEVHIMEVDEYPGGVGEPSTPPIAPAITNAVFAATGERIRSLPLMKHGYKFV